MTYAIIEESGWEAVAKIREQRKSCGGGVVTKRQVIASMGMR
jgi:hypothetical protein